MTGPVVDNSLERVLVDSSGDELGTATNPLETSGSIGTITLPSAIYNGKKTVSTPGTAEIIASSQTLVAGVTVKALIGNTGRVYVGNSGVDSSNGFELDPGQTIFVEIDNINKVYVDVATASDGVTWIAT